MKGRQPLPDALPLLPEAPRGGSWLVATSQVGWQESAALTEAHITYPEPGSSEPVYSLPLEGWVVPSRTPPREILVHCGSRLVARLPVAIERPDIAALHPEVPWSAHAGFAVRLNALELPRRFRLVLSLVLEDGQRVPFGEISGERRPLPVQERAAHQPLIVTTLGRSGSTWLTSLLGLHPEIADYRSFEYESKVTAYFAEALRALTRPSSYYQAMRGEIAEGDWWLGRDPSEALAWYSSQDSIDEWLGTEYVADLIEFFAGRIDALFGRIAQSIGKEDATFVIEKMPPAWFAQELLWELFPGTREIFLVRDFRDVACSMFAFGDKRSRRWYPHSGALTQEECIRHPLRKEAEGLLESWQARADQAFLIRYEDLVLRPGQALQGLFEYLGIDSGPETVAGVIDSGAGLDGELQDFHRTSPSARDSVGRWRRDLDPDLMRVCDQELHDVLEAFGYT